MKDDISDIVEMYDRDPEGEHDRLAQHQLEFDLTMKALAQYLPGKGSILEIGAASGRYTVALVRLGYQVTAVDLSEALAEKWWENFKEPGLEQRVRHVISDARDLGELGEEEFDAVLMMGPLYHLVEESDRKLAIQEAYDRLRKGGVFVSAFISRLGILGDLLKNVPEWIEQEEEVRSVIERGRDPEDYPRGGFRGYFARVSEIAPLHESIGLETLAVMGIEPAISADDESYNNLQGKQRQMWLDLLYEVREEASIVGASRHLLYVGRK